MSGCSQRGCVTCSRTALGVVSHRADKRVREQPLDGPLASQEMGAEVFELADEMMRDLTGWRQLFGVKAIEAG